MSELSQRLGRIRISDFFLHREPEAIMLIARDIFALRVEHLYHTECFEIVAVSPKFDIVPRGYEAPWYSAEVHKADDGALTIEWKTA